MDVTVPPGGPYRQRPQRGTRGPDPELAGSASGESTYVSSGIGCPINNERDVQGRRGRIQDFVNGQIAWSPDQAPKMTVWSIKNKNQIHVRWSTNDNYSYDFYIIRQNLRGEVHAR